MPLTEQSVSVVFDMLTMAPVSPWPTMFTLLSRTLDKVAPLVAPQARHMRVRASRGSANGTALARKETKESLMQQNVGRIERWGRAALGGVLIAGSIGAITRKRHTAAAALGATGAVLLETAITRVCPVNALLGIGSHVRPSRAQARASALGTHRDFAHHWSSLSAVPSRQERPL